MEGALGEEGQNLTTALASSFFGLCLGCAQRSTAASALGCWQVPFVHIYFSSSLVCIYSDPPSSSAVSPSSPI